MVTSFTLLLELVPVLPVAVAIDDYDVRFIYAVVVERRNGRRSGLSAILHLHGRTEMHSSTSRSQQSILNRKSILHLYGHVGGAKQIRRLVAFRTFMYVAISKPVFRFSSV